jgi:hypothetical protein
MRRFLVAVLAICVSILTACCSPTGPQSNRSRNPIVGIWGEVFQQEVFKEVTYPEDTHPWYTVTLLSKVIFTDSTFRIELSNPYDPYRAPFVQEGTYSLSGDTLVLTETYVGDTVSVYSTSYLWRASYGSLDISTLPFRIGDQWAIWSPGWFWRTSGLLGRSASFGGKSDGTFVPWGPEDTADSTAHGRHPGE